MRGILNTKSARHDKIRTSENLRQRNVTVINEDPRTLRCDECGQRWYPNMRPDGRYYKLYWQCPNNCNAPSKPNYQKTNNAVAIYNLLKYLDSSNKKPLNTSELLRAANAWGSTQYIISKAKELGLIRRWQEPGEEGNGFPVFQELTDKSKQYLETYQGTFTMKKEEEL